MEAIDNKNSKNIRNDTEFEDVEKRSYSILAEHEAINRKYEAIYWQNDILTSMTEDCATVRRQTHSEV